MPTAVDRLLEADHQNRPSETSARLSHIEQSPVCRETILKDGVGRSIPALRELGATLTCGHVCVMS